jgi:hypothetical protein
MVLTGSFNCYLPHEHLVQANTTSTSTQFQPPSSQPSKQQTCHSRQSALHLSKCQVRLPLVKLKLLRRQALRRVSRTRRAAPQTHQARTAQPPRAAAERTAAKVASYSDCQLEACSKCRFCGSTVTAAGVGRASFCTSRVFNIGRLPSFRVSIYLLFSMACYIDSSWGLGFE